MIRIRDVKEIANRVLRANSAAKVVSVLFNRRRTENLQTK